MDKTTYPTLALYVTEQTEHGYYHIYACPVVLHTERPGSIRNANDWTTVKGGWFLDNFHVYSQGNPEDVTRLTNTRGAHLYGFEASYRTSTVDLSRAEKMVKTLRKLEKALDKLNVARGYVTSYGEYVTRIAEVFGCEFLVFPTRPARGSWSYDDVETQTLTLGEGRRQIDHLEHTWRESLKKQEAV